MALLPREVIAGYGARRARHAARRAHFWVALDALMSVGAAAASSRFATRKCFLNVCAVLVGGGGRAPHWQRAELMYFPKAARKTVTRKL
jgi:hypothetical protein